MWWTCLKSNIYATYHFPGALPCHGPRHYMISSVIYVVPDEYNEQSMPLPYLWGDRTSLVKIKQIFGSRCPLKAPTVITKIWEEVPHIGFCQYCSELLLHFFCIEYRHVNHWNANLTPTERDTLTQWRGQRGIICRHGLWIQPALHFNHYVCACVRSGPLASQQ